MLIHIPCTVGVKYFAQLVMKSIFLFDAMWDAGTGNSLRLISVI